MNGTGLVSNEGSAWMRGLCHSVVNCTDPGSWIFPPTASILSHIRFTNPDGADSEPYQSVLVCSSESVPTEKQHLPAVKRT